ncbi:hypothetical protein Pfo_027071, partial [Paulownia fortunei]
DTHKEPYICNPKKDQRCMKQIQVSYFCSIFLSHDLGVVSESVCTWHRAASTEEIGETLYYRSSSCMPKSS